MCSPTHGVHTYRVKLKQNPWILWVAVRPVSDIFIPKDM